MAPEFAKEQNFEKQMRKQIGCMTGFLQIFDRHQIMIGKRLYSPKRLPPSPSVDETPESEKSAPASPAISGDLGKRVHSHNAEAWNPSKPKQFQEAETRSPVSELPPKSSLPFPIVELKDGNRSHWKFGKEAPRLSLDSRATTDAKGGLHPTDGGQNHRSPSVIARLMGLEPLPDSPGAESERQPELRRSASESRVSKDFIHSRFTTDGTNFYSKQQSQSPSTYLNNVMKDKTPTGGHYADPLSHSLRHAEQIKGLNRGFPNSAPPWRTASPQRKSFFDSADYFPEPKHSVSIYGEIERRLKTGEMDEQSKDLETLKQILEALQLKGLLHPKQPFQQNQVRHRNFVYDESPIVLLKSSVPTSTNCRIGSDYSPSNGRRQVRSIRRNYTIAGETSPSASPRRELNVRSPTRSSRSPRHAECNPSARQLTTITKPRSRETQKKLNQSPENRRLSPVQSPVLASRSRHNPKVNSRSKSIAGTHQKGKITNFVMEDDTSSTSGSSSTETERPRSKEHKETLLERCDKLLHSISVMAGSEMQQQQQPSPVSVLDPSLYKDEVLTPSPVTTKRHIYFKDESDEVDEDVWSPVISPIQSKCIDPLVDPDYVYVSDILRASHYLPDSDIFLVLEKQQYLKGNDMSKCSQLQRKLTFDTIDEILDRGNRMPPWSNGNMATVPSLDKVWSEFQRIQEHESIGGDLFDTVCGILKKDLAGDAVTGWGSHPVEMSEAVLDVERLIFKDLICEAIQDLAALASRGVPSSPHMVPRRRLVF